MPPKLELLRYKPDPIDQLPLFEQAMLLEGFSDFQEEGPEEFFPNISDNNPVKLNNWRDNLVLAYIKYKNEISSVKELFNDEWDLTDEIENGDSANLLDSDEYFRQHVFELLMYLDAADPNILIRERILPFERMHRVPIAVVDETYSRIASFLDGKRDILQKHVKGY